MRRRALSRLAMVLLGNLIYAFAAAFFILPAGLSTGGSTGLALFVRQLTGIPAAPFVFAFNLLMFLIGAAILGRAFALTTLLSTVAYPLFLGLMERLAERTGPLTSDPMLCALFAGVLIGAGIALVIREGASTGGMDIPPLVLHKYTGLSVAMLLYLFDALILLLQFPFSPREQALYGILLVCVYSVVLEKLLVVGQSKVQLKIVSPRYEEINDVILHQFDRGTTLLEVEGGLTRRESYAVLTVVDQRQLFRLCRAVEAIDPEAFLIVGQVREVRGRGFTRAKEYREDGPALRPGSDSAGQTRESRQ